MLNLGKLAQGTTEYLIIVAIVVVISLVVVGLMMNSTSSASAVSANSTKIQTESQQLAITESLTDTNGHLIITFKNNSPDPITLNSINVNGNTTYPDNITMGIGESKTIYLNKPNLGATTNNQITFTYTTNTGLTKNQTTNTTNTNQIPTITPTNTATLLQANNCFDWNSSLTYHPICTCDDLNTIDYNSTTLGWSYSLQNNLDFRNCDASYRTDPGWNPIGPDASHQFSGKFLGNNHTIKNLYINRPSTDNVGLFGYMDAGNLDVNNLGMVDSNIIGHNYVGGISGRYGKMNNCFNTGNISGAGYAGGLVGGIGIINNSYNTGNVYSLNRVGGINGGDGGTITNSYNTGTITGPYVVGGINGASGTITNSYNTGTLNATDYSGGISGYNATIINSHNTGTIVGTGSYTGGIIGYGGTITNSYNTGTVNGSGNYTGGITGAYGTTNNSFNTGAINGSNGTAYYTGGINGGGGTVNNCYNTGAIQAAGLSVGGINGGFGIITNSYNTGNVSRGTYAGGITGWSRSDSSTINSFSTGSINGSYGAIGYFTGGPLINLHWYDSNLSDNATTCYPTGDANCTKYVDANASLLYSQSNALYTTSPAWDANWVWHTNAYPTLAWQS